jgi:hypothetical protein
LIDGVVDGGLPRSMEKQLGSCHNISFALLSFWP